MLQWSGDRIGQLAWYVPVAVFHILFTPFGSFMESALFVDILINHCRIGTILPSICKCDQCITNDLLT